MKKWGLNILILLALILVIWLMANSSKLASQGDYYKFTVDVDGHNRNYLVYVPSSYDSNQAVPLVLFFHGGGGSMRRGASDYGWPAKAQAEGFIVAFPNGASRWPFDILATWNAGKCCGYARDIDSDDVGYTKVVIADLKNRFNILDNQIFATGFSNGALMVQRLACELPEILTAVASVAGTDNTLSCQPSEPISILLIHAQDDDHVLFSGGSGPGSVRNKETITEFTSVLETLERWLKRNKLTSNSRRVWSHSLAYCDLYASATSGATEAQVKLCVTETGGHTWPKGRSGLLANDVIWDFFQLSID